jgi:flagellar biosynthesis/type III secretory pathway protein FliH
MTAAKPYAGRLVARLGPDGGRAMVPTDPVERARLEAAAILAEAQAAAEAHRVALSAQAEAEFGRALAERLTAAAFAYEQGLRDVTGTLAAILDDAVRQILGQAPQRTAGLAALRTAIARRVGETRLTIHVCRRDYPAMKAAESETAPPNSGAVAVLIDEQLAPGECVLDTGTQRFEVGLEAQIRAFRRSLVGTLDALVRDEDERSRP